jgi:thiol-disulfide isomerase/thioredoxin
MRSIVVLLMVCTYLQPANAQDWVSKQLPKDGAAPSMDFVERIKHQVERSLNAQSPNLSFQDIYSGKRDSLTSLRGKVVMVNVWNMHCGPCIAELPTLQRVQSKLGKRGFVLLAISPDDTANQRYFFASKKLNLGGITAMKRLWDDPYPFPFTWFITPAAYIVDRKGVLREYWEGTKSYEELSSTIAKYL